MKFVLTILGGNKYKNLVKSGERKSPNEDQKLILTIRAQMEDIKKDLAADVKRNLNGRKEPINEVKWVNNKAYHRFPKHKM